MYILWGRFSPQHHVQLVHSVYPKHASDQGKARGNKLSLLLFYASSRPGKLAKIGRYLRFKTDKDVLWPNTT